MKFSTIAALASAAALLLPAASFAEDTPQTTEQAAKEYTLTIKDHIFTPDMLEIPAGEKVTINVVNQDATPEEFESEDLDREKVVPGNSTGIVLLGPLETGEYTFVGEYNEATAKGKIVVK